MAKKDQVTQNDAPKDDKVTQYLDRDPNDPRNRAQEPAETSDLKDPKQAGGIDETRKDS